MSKRSRTLTHKHTQTIKRHGNQVGYVRAPKGTAFIWERIKEGVNTGFAPRSYYYVELPNGEIASLKKRTLLHWEEQNFEVYFQNKAIQKAILKKHNIPMPYEKCGECE